jgi:hypothetical protein
VDVAVVVPGVSRPLQHGQELHAAGHSRRPPQILGVHVRIMMLNCAAMVRRRSLDVVPMRTPMVGVVAW